MVINTTIKEVHYRQLVTSNNGTETACATVCEPGYGVVPLIGLDGFTTEAVNDPDRRELILSVLGAAMAVAEHRSAQLVIEWPEAALLATYKQAGLQFSTKAGKPYVGWPEVTPDNGAQKNRLWLERVSFFKDGKQAASCGYFLPSGPVSWFEDRYVPFELGTNTAFTSVDDVNWDDLYTAGTALIECVAEQAQVAGRTRLAITITEDAEVELWAASLGFSFYAHGQTRPVWVKTLPTITERLGEFSLEELAAEVERRTVAYPSRQLEFQRPTTRSTR